MLIPGVVFLFHGFFRGLFFVFTGFKSGVYFVMFVLHGSQDIRSQDATNYILA